jgi:hypothetical protein
VEGPPEKIRLDDQDLHTVMIACWDPVRRTFHARRGEQVIYVITRSFHDSIERDLVRVLEAQDAFHETHARYGSDLAQLGIREVTEGIEIDVVSADSGWRATARGDLLLQTCHIFVGEIEPENGLEEPRTVACRYIELPQG